MDGEDVFQQYKATPLKQKRSIWYSRNAERIRWALGSMKRSPIMFLISNITGLAILQSVVTLLVYGKDHPLNRFHWRLMEKRGELSPELLEKRKTMNAYYMSSFTQLSPKWLNFRSNRNPEYQSLAMNNFD